MTEGTSRRLAKEFREKIRSGQWPAGQRVPTTRQLAASYGVSVNTVQNAFRELEAGDLVERKPRLGGYVKRGVPTLSPKAHTIAVVGPYTEELGYGNEIEMSWEHRITRGCDAGLSEGGFHVSIFSCDRNDPQALAKVLAKVDQAGETLGGVLCFLYPVLKNLPAELDKRNLAWVTVNRSKEHAFHNFVTQDVVTGSRLVARCLSRMGVKRTALVFDRFQVGRSTGDKYFGFMEGWLETGNASRDVDVVQCDGFHEPVGYERMAEYLKRHGRPDAVYASGDLLALGAVRALREAGAEVGKDVKVIGSTGLSLSAYAHPPLTVLEVPMERMGREAARMLLGMAREGVRRMVGRYVPSMRIVVRESCPIPQDVIDEEAKLIEGQS